MQLKLYSFAALMAILFCGIFQTTTVAQEPTPVPLSSGVGYNYRWEIDDEADGVDEIISIGSDGHLYMYNYQGQQLFKSLANNWKLVTTGNLDADLEDEIIVVGEEKIKIYNLHRSGSLLVGFEIPIDTSGYIPQSVAVGNFLNNDSEGEIALLLTNAEQSKLLVFNLPMLTAVATREWETIKWSNVAVGDYDGNGDDDLALIGWNYGAGITHRGTLILLEGENINQYLQNKPQTTLNIDDEWLSIAAGNIDFSHPGADWVGSKAAQQTTQVAYWEDGIYEAWHVSPAFEYLATADIRNEGNDQVVMLRNTTDGVSIQFATQSVVWSYDNGLGPGWLSLVAGNLDQEQTYQEVLLVKENLARVYLRPQAGMNDSVYLDCTNEQNCLEFSGAFGAELALGDIGETILEKPFYHYLPLILLDTP